MIINLEHGDRARVWLSREFVAVDNESVAEVVAVKLEDFTPTEARSLALVLTVREARKVAGQLLWLAEQIEEAQDG